MMAIPIYIVDLEYTPKENTVIDFDSAIPTKTLYAGATREEAFNVDFPDVLRDNLYQLVKAHLTIRVFVDSKEVSVYRCELDTNPDPFADDAPDAGGQERSYVAVKDGLKDLRAEIEEIERQTLELTERRKECVETLKKLEMVFDTPTD